MGDVSHARGGRQGFGIERGLKWLRSIGRSVPWGAFTLWGWKRQTDERPKGISFGGVNGGRREEEGLSEFRDFLKSVF